MIFEIIRGGGGGGGEGTDWVGKEWASLFFPRGKNWLGVNSGLLHRLLFSPYISLQHDVAAKLMLSLDVWFICNWPFTTCICSNI